MKTSATQKRKLTQDPDPAGHIAAGSINNAGTVETGKEQDLVELVWKYFGEEISEMLREVQEALAPEQSGSTQKVSRRIR